MKRDVPLRHEGGIDHVGILPVSVLIMLHREMPATMT